MSLTMLSGERPFARPSRLGPPVPSPTTLTFKPVRPSVVNCICPLAGGCRGEARPDTMLKGHLRQSEIAPHCQLAHAYIAPVCASLVCAALILLQPMGFTAALRWRSVAAACGERLPFGHAGDHRGTLQRLTMDAARARNDVVLLGLRYGPNASAIAGFAAL